MLRAVVVLSLLALAGIVVYAAWTDNTPTRPGWAQVPAAEIPGTEGMRDRPDGHSAVACEEAGFSCRVCVPLPAGEAPAADLTGPVPDGGPAGPGGFPWRGFLMSLAAGLALATVFRTRKA